MYLYVKVIHIAAIISWMAGVLYHYRLLINIKDSKGKHADVHDTLYAMAARLYRISLMPAMGVSFIAGIALIAMNPTIFRDGGFMHVKLLLVVLLVIVTAKGGKLMRSAKENSDALPSSKTLRIMNEIPTVLMLLILVLIVARPF